MCSLTDISGHPRTYKYYFEKFVASDLVDRSGCDALEKYLGSKDNKYSGKQYPDGNMLIAYQVGQAEVATRLARFRLLEPWQLKPKSLKWNGRNASYNARDDKLLEPVAKAGEKKPRAGMWPKHFATRRCLIFVTGFYELQYRNADESPAPGDDKPHHKCRYKMTVTPEFPGYILNGKIGEPEYRHSVFAFAGLYNDIDCTVEDGASSTKGAEKTVNLVSTAIVTTSANDKLAWVHNADPDDPRMPLILDPKDYEAWLDVESVPPEKAIKLCKPSPDRWLNAQEG